MHRGEQVQRRKLCSLSFMYSHCSKKRTEVKVRAIVYASNLFYNSVSYCLTCVFVSRVSTRNRGYLLFTEVKPHTFTPVQPLTTDLLTCTWFRPITKHCSLEKRKSICSFLFIFSFRITYFTKSNSHTQFNPSLTLILSSLYIRGVYNHYTFNSCFIVDYSVSVIRKAY